MYCYTYIYTSAVSLYDLYNYIYYDEHATGAIAGTAIHSSAYYLQTEENMDGRSPLILVWHFLYPLIFMHDFFNNNNMLFIIRQ